MSGIRRYLRKTELSLQKELVLATPLSSFSQFQKTELLVYLIPTPAFP